MSKLNKIRFVVGDRYGDSHGRTKDHIIMSNLTAQEIKDTFDDALKVTDFDWREFQSYSMVIPLEIVKQFMNIGFKFNRYHISDTFTCVTSPYLLYEVYTFLIKLASPFVTFEEIQAQEVYIGGEAVLSEDSNGFMLE